MRKALFLRGGDEDYDDDYDIEFAVSEDDESEDDEPDSEEIEDEIESLIAQEEGDNTEEEEVEEDREEEVAKEDGQGETPVSALPVKITLKTSLGDNILIDQSIEITASPSRTVHSLKQSVSRQFKGRPPIDAIVLRLDGLVLQDDVLVKDLVLDIEEEDDEDEEEDEDGLTKMTITVDMVPPVDPKFGVEIKERLDKMTNEEVLDTYVKNLAALYQNSLDLMTPTDDSVEKVEEHDGEEKEQSASKMLVTQKKLAMQQYALMLKGQLVSSMNENEKTLLEKQGTPSNLDDEDDELDSYGGDLLLKESMKRRRKRKGGATANMKRALQKNLNINWPDTIRNFVLFLFFGYFGGRNAMSRTIMLLGAPACFIIQARPVKVAIKQLFYTIGEPPGILLSLLPAPQQAIMSCDYDSALKSVYGDDIEKYNEMTNTESLTSNDNDMDAEEMEEEFYNDFDS
eukprot:CAMPEP_0176477600 /NCGR_PEP_ID=MMETSP0200_2-20121128/715_1 /TAXON_ID=947934 /ORGANISM="Chaetoceros sp., Strain GSL56" /LENGTH=456 /DNA_ID=CAMNT_0017873433 /DNA_START=163 /DNA_END=1533 /DNA_ORIENTATION=-